MSEFKKVEHAQFSPTSCTLCGAHEGPFIDTHLDLPVHGHVYICASTSRRAGCIRQMARLDGMVEEVKLGELIAREAALHDTIADLQDELENSKVVPMHQVVEWMGGGEGFKVRMQEMTTSSTATVAPRRGRKGGDSGEAA